VYDDVKLGPHLFRCLCQNSECKAPIGGIHIPSVHGRVVHFCYICCGATEFRNGPDGFEAKFLGVSKTLQQELAKRMRRVA